MYGPIHWICLTKDGMLLEYVGKGTPWKITEVSENNHGVVGGNPGGDPGRNLSAKIDFLF